MSSEKSDERGFFSEMPFVEPPKTKATAEKPHYLGHRERL